MTASAQTANSPRSLSDLSRDERGAVMLMGLFFASFLVGSLWYMIGLGQALVFREIGQEIADSAALTSASVHAQGMNFIGALNVIQLALTVSHLVFAFIFLIILIIGALTAETIIGGVVAVLTDEGGIVPVWKAYDNAFMFTALEACAVTQTVTSGASPWLGALAAVNVGNTYPGGRPSFAVSPSMVPTTAESVLDPGWWKDVFGVESANVAFALPPFRGKLGLPVQEQTFGALCERVYNATYNWVVQQMLNNPIYKLIVRAARVAKRVLDNPIGGFFGDLLPGGHQAEVIANAIVKVDDALHHPDGDGFIQQAINFSKSAGATIASTLLCNGGAEGISGIPVIGEALATMLKDLLGSPAVQENPLIPPAFDIRWNTILGMGPKTMWGPAQNGSPWMAVMGYQGSIGGGNGSYSDRSNSKVGLLAGGGAAASTLPTYVAQAEFYFDCEGGWGGATCNQDDAALYSMRWTARLRQVRHIDPSRLLADVAVDAGGNALDSLIGMLSDTIGINDSTVGGYFEFFGADSFATSAVVDSAKDRANTKIDSALKGGSLDALH